MRFVKSLIVGAVVLGSANTVFAVDQEVSPDTYRQATVNQFYGRSDGIFYDKNNKIPQLISNGDGFYPMGPTYRNTFGYGDGLGVMCETVSRTGNVGFSVAASANAACDTTCGNSACVMGFEAALADAGDILACTDATADACLCQTTSLDEVLLGCGTNWEAPALGVSLMTFADGVKLAHVALLAQDIGPDMDANGLDISGDQTDNDGVEILGGMYGASGRPMIPGVDPAFKFCVSIAEVEDVSGYDDIWIGWRDTTPPNATFNSYNSYAAVGWDASADGDLHTETEDDGGGTTTTDITVTAIADTEGRDDICILVSDTGVVTYEIDGTVPSDAVSYTFDSGEPIIPFMTYLHTSDVGGELVIDEWEVSYQ